MPDTANIAQSSPGSYIRIRARSPMRSAISFAFGLGGPISEGRADFFISEEMHALAARIAARNACLCFVGLLPNGTQILSTDREDLLDRGCDRIAWIARDGSAA